MHQGDADIKHHGHAGIIHHADAGIMHHRDASRQKTRVLGPVPEDPVFMRPENCAFPDSPRFLRAFQNLGVSKISE